MAGDGAEERDISGDNPGDMRQFLQSAAEVRRLIRSANVIVSQFLN